MRRLALTLLAILVLSSILLSPRAEAAESGQITPAAPKMWLPLTLNFRGPAAGEMDNNPNPFLGYRLQVVFTGPSGQKYNVPGFFDGDGQGGAKGDVWRVRFAADEAGSWKYTASFRKGDNVAISLDASAGNPAGFDGASGSFEVGPADQSSGDFYKWGRLEYAGKFYLKFRNGPYWIKGGTDEPENFLAYAGFDRTPPSHRYAAHVSDWRPGDPDWGGGKGKGIIGALNYLASKHANCIYFLPMNIGGDGCDVWPYAGKIDPKGSPADDNLHFDLGKLAQWETVFAHAQRKGIFLHCVFDEAEKANKLELDNAELGPERKLYYREMIARFGHHLAMQWNICEEYNDNEELAWTSRQIEQFADYIGGTDPYDHPITVHPVKDPFEALRFMFGDKRFSILSIQTEQRRIDTIVEQFRKATAEAGRPLPVGMDEFTVNAGQPFPWNPADDAALMRKEKLWPIYLSGGIVEFILDDALKTESF